jgi:hypothetical protein
MIADIRKCLSRRPFMPLTIHSADGMAFHVLRVDHAAVSPTGNRVIVFLDDDTTEFLFRC